MTEYFICAAYNPVTKKTGKLWLVTEARLDRWQSGQTIHVRDREYLLGRRELWGRGDVSSYELILREEVLEL